MIRLMGLTAISEDYYKSIAWAIIGQGILIEQEPGLLGEYLALRGLSSLFYLILTNLWRKIIFFHRKGRAYFVEYILVRLFKQSITRTKAFLTLM